MKELKTNEKGYQPVLPPRLTLAEAKELFGNVEPYGHRLVICSPLAYTKTPGSNIIISDKRKEDSNLQLARNGAMIVNFPTNPNLEGKNIIVNDFSGGYQVKVTINKDVTLHDGTVVKDVPTSYLCIVIYGANIVCFV